jgi:hypothetical protein
LYAGGGGVDVGSAVGVAVGSGVGVAVGGNGVGVAVGGNGVGVAVGNGVGVAVGTAVGVAVGNGVGVAVGQEKHTSRAVAVFVLPFFWYCLILPPELNQNKPLESISDKIIEALTVVELHSPLPLP